ncbi:MAG: bacteriohemerythrin [Bryobacteraceae bacterium]
MFQWRDDFGIGVPEIDAQHNTLFRTAEEVHKALLGGHGQDILVKVFVRLIAYTRTHFAAEEKLMQASGYPEYERHKAMHVEFTAKVKQFCRDLNSGRIPLTAALLKFLEGWLAEHICEADRRLGIHLRAKSQLLPPVARIG